MCVRVFPMLMTMGMAVTMHLSSIGRRYDELAVQHALGAKQCIGN